MPWRKHSSDKPSLHIQSLSHAVHLQDYICKMQGRGDNATVLFRTPKLPLEPSAHGGG